MEAKVERKDDVIIISLSGRIDYESTDQFRKTCLELLRQERVVFNLENLSFVGSSGITTFVETMSDLFKVSDSGLKFCHVSSEFRKVFDSSPLKGIEIYTDSEIARNSFNFPQIQHSQEMHGFLESDSAQPESTAENTEIFESKLRLNVEFED